MRTLPAIGLVMILAGLGAYYATGQLSLFTIANVATGPLLLLTAAVLQSRRIRGFSGTQSRRVVLRWAAILGGVTIAVVGLNALASDWRARLDLTVARSYSLSEQSRAVCQALDARSDAPAIELYFFEESLLARDVRLLVQAYEARCKRVTVREGRYEDAPPEAARVFGRTSTTVVACASGLCEPVGYPSEQAITNAMLRLMRQRAVLAYFVVGHGEVDLADETETGFSALAASLRDEGITPRALVGPAQQEIPADADLLIIASPERDFLPPELAAIERYLARGGRLLVLLEPGMRSNLAQLLEHWGFGLPDGVIADQATTPLLRQPRDVSLLAHLFSPYHPVTRGMSNRTMVLAPTARPVLAVHKPEPQDRLEELLHASARAWIEQDVVGALAGRPIRRDPDEASGSEVSIAAAGSYPRQDREARIVVVGDRDFASNRLLSSLYDRDLLMNAVWWLAGEEQQVAIRPKSWTPDQDPLTLQQTVAYFYFMAFALPEALLLLGIRAWYRQRS